MSTMHALDDADAVQERAELAWLAQGQLAAAGAPPEAARWPSLWLASPAARLAAVVCLLRGAVWYAGKSCTVISTAEKG